MTYTKSDSDDSTSISSPPPAYTVENPPSDAPDLSSANASPTVTSPGFSPRRSSFSRHSGVSSANAPPPFAIPANSPRRSSSSRHSVVSSSCSRISGPYAKILADREKKEAERLNRIREWRFSVIREEEEEDGKLFYFRSNSDFDDEVSRRFHISLAVLGLILMLCTFCFIIRSSIRPFPPRIIVKSLRVHHFYFGQGSDSTGVPTKMITMNCSLEIKVDNYAKYFGIYVSSMPINLMYSEITAASGELKETYQSRKSEMTEFVNLEGVGVPLYGAGLNLVISDSHMNQTVPFKLRFDVQSRGNGLGRLVSSKYTRRISCSFAIQSGSYNNKPIIFENDSCAYD
ncbi:uncharacterized protein LOC126670585 [Mercurialis annua]|uniref:uncharacterized protein LOC126670585 n=1 Tax=Mercurialis annua TaxID=3986 RepID=UPI00215FDED9|nr:uncharacterized protein LOC126670585 [Mercurialis annua]